MRIVGILLAAGAGTRFGGEKLVARLDDGMMIGVRAAENLRAALGHVIAVVRPNDGVLARALEEVGAAVVECADAHAGMGASLAAAVRAATDADGYVVALADMPWIAPATIRAIAAAVEEGASIVAPRIGGRRGHPVGFSRRHRAALVSLEGDTGARDLIAATPDVTWIDVDDAGIVRDVDVPGDLRSTRQAKPTRSA